MIFYVTCVFLPSGVRLLVKNIVLDLGCLFYFCEGICSVQKRSGYNTPVVILSSIRLVFKALDYILSPPHGLSTVCGNSHYEMVNSL